MSWEELEAYRNIHEMFRRNDMNREVNFPPRIEEPADRREPPGSRGTEPVVSGSQVGAREVPRLFAEEPNRLTGEAGQIRENDIVLLAPSVEVLFRSPMASSDADTDSKPNVIIVISIISARNYNNML